LLLTFSPSLLAQMPLQSGAQHEAASAKPVDPHDLSGVWEALGRVTTGNEVSPMKAWGKQVFEEHRPFNGPRMIPLEESNDPMIKCDPLGFPRNLFYEIRHLKFVQTPSEVG
jgi:hypothetical protein